MTGYDALFRSVLTRIDPERAHHLGFRALKLAQPVTKRLRPLPANPVQALGLTFANPLGLAAGFDKNAAGIDALARLGFGHVEVGTVTARPQPGNERPRLFRLPKDRAVINRMGFNNEGAEAVARRLALRMSGPSGTRAEVVLGINIGKSKVVPDDDLDAVIEDYLTSTRLLAPYADYLVVNVSSPNTPGLRNLQAVDRLGPLLQSVGQYAKDVPLLVKIAPDLADEDIVAVADLAGNLGLDGIVATNTTISRAGLRTDPAQVAAIGAGGLSGSPVALRAREVLALLRQNTEPGMTIIAAGGVDSAAEAKARLDAGANLVQAYTGFIYGGPRWPRQLVQALEAHGAR